MVSSGDSLSHVDVIVLDEVHYLSDISRGTVWEEIVSKIFKLPEWYLLSYLCVHHIILTQKVSEISGYLLPKKGPTHMSVGNSCKSR